MNKSDAIGATIGGQLVAWPSGEGQQSVWQRASSANLNRHWNTHKKADNFQEAST